MIDTKGKNAAKRAYLEKMIEAQECNTVIKLEEQIDIIIRAYLENVAPPETKAINGRYRGHHKI